MWLSDVAANERCGTCTIRLITPNATGHLMRICPTLMLHENEVVAIPQTVKLFITRAVRSELLACLSNQLSKLERRFAFGIARERLFW